MIVVLNDTLIQQSHMLLGNPIATSLSIRVVMLKNSQVCDGLQLPSVYSYMCILAIVTDSNLSLHVVGHCMNAQTQRLL